MNSNDNDMIEIDLLGLLQAVMKRLWIIVLAAVLFAAAGYVISRFAIEPRYVSTTSVYILNRQDTNTLTYNDVQLSMQIGNDYSGLVKSRRVLEDVISNLGLVTEPGMLEKRIDVSSQNNTRIIYISVVDPNPAMAQKIADEIRVVASDQIQRVMEIEAVNVVDVADYPVARSGPSIKGWTICAALIGVLLVLSVILIRFISDDSIKNSEEAERYLGLNTLAMIPRFESETETYKKRKR